MQNCVQHLKHVNEQIQSLTRVTGSPCLRQHRACSGTIVLKTELAPSCSAPYILQYARQCRRHSHGTGQET